VVHVGDAVPRQRDPEGRGNGGGAVVVERIPLADVREPVSFDREAFTFSADVSDGVVDSVAVGGCELVDTARSDFFGPDELGGLAIQSAPEATAELIHGGPDSSGRTLTHHRQHTRRSMEQIATDRSGTPLLVTIPEAARLLAVGRSTLYELIGSGQLTTVHIGRSVRIAVDELEAFVSRRKSVVGQP
jgi:excisionase family DNA binding protein